MKLYSNRALGGVFLLVAIVSGWCFVAGFEQAWSRGHITTLVILISALPLSIYFYGRDFFHR
jgi:hypothetical protein